MLNVPVTFAYVATDDPLEDEYPQVMLYEAGERELSVLRANGHADIDGITLYVRALSPLRTGARVNTAEYVLPP